MATRKTPRAIQIFLAPWLTVGAVAACGGHRIGAPLDERDTGRDASSQKPGFLSTPAPTGSPVQAPGDTQADAATAGCVPEAGTDEPDQDFVDSNCDGIDGDVNGAIFVAPAGIDSASGTMSAPVQTIGKAVALAAAQSKSVYICNATYAENVDIEGTAVNIYGGYDCSSGWQRVRDRALIKPPSGRALTVRNTAAPVFIDRLGLYATDAADAADAAAPSSSSIAASVDRATVHFTQTEFVAGNGTDGAAGATVAEPNWNLARDGKAGQSIPLPEGSICYIDWPAVTPPAACSQVAQGGFSLEMTELCPFGRANGKGGRGGNGGNAGLGRAATAGDSGAVFATNGIDGASGNDGTMGASFGTLRDGLYLATNAGTDGTPGQAGTPGRGGAGGTSPIWGDTVPTYLPGGGGGEGGSAGCGGPAGKGGGAGGASIGLVVSKGTVTLDWSLIITGRGGAGGNGTSGRAGQHGGEGGPGGTSPGMPGEQGEFGGFGGRGGTAGPGGGGPSVGIAWSESTVATSNTDFELGLSGHGGVSPGGEAPDGDRMDIDPPLAASTRDGGAP